MNLKKLHYTSGVTLAIFIALHLFNHFYSVFGTHKHIALMEAFRPFYRNVFIETLLVLAVVVQIYSGLKLYKIKRHTVASLFEKIHLWSGLYLALFLLIHVSAVFAARLYLKLDTNFYFGVAGLNYFPTNLFFIPYYALAICSFFAHVAAIHHAKMQHSVIGLTPTKQAKIILVLGVIFTGVTFYGLTNHFHGVQLPVNYHILIGK